VYYRSYLGGGLDIIARDVMLAVIQDGIGRLEILVPLIQCRQRGIIFMTSCRTGTLQSRQLQRETDKHDLHDYISFMNEEEGCISNITKVK